MFALGCGWGFAESLCWSMSVIIFRAEIKAGTGLKQGTVTGTENKDKLRVQASSGTGWKTSTDIT